MLVRLIASLMLTSLCYSNLSLAFFDSHLPLSTTETKKRIPMRHLATLDPSKLLSSLKLGSQTVQLRINADEDLVLSGQMAQRGSWSMRVGSISTMFPTEAYQADLDGNGQQDLVLLKPTAGNGLAPSQHLTVLSFDQKGQVIPWQIEGYFTTDQQGIVDLLDLNGNGRAELVYMSYGEGYWQTVLYEIEDGRWKQIRGQFAGKNYPLLTRFTLKPNHKIANPKSLQALEPINLATDQAVLAGYLKSYQWADIEQSEDITLMLTVNNKWVKCQPASWYSLAVLVLDRPQQREIISLATHAPAFQRGLQEAIQKHYAVKLYGQRSSERCSPEQIWVQP